MTPELTVLGLAAILQAIQIGIAGYFMNRDAGTDWPAGPRDTEPPMSALTGRLRRAVANHFEALAFFTIAVVLVSLSGDRGTVTATCAWVYLLARIAYIPAYALGWSPGRSLIFAAGMLATLTMILIALL